MNEQSKELVAELRKCAFSRDPSAVNEDRAARLLRQAAARIEYLERCRCELRESLAVMVDHSTEAYPHFESERGQRDIRNAREAMSKCAPAQEVSP